MIEYKLVILGSAGVGKSALTVQFVQSTFVERYDPTIEDSYRKTIEIDGQLQTLEILDTAGTEQFIAMRDVYVKGGQGFVLVYSISSVHSFKEVIGIHEQILQIKKTKWVPMILVGNKSDCEAERAVSRSEGEALAKAWHCAFEETSARLNINVENVFQSVVYQIIEGPSAISDGLDENEPFGNENVRHLSNKHALRRTYQRKKIKCVVM